MTYVSDRVALGAESVWLLGESSGTTMVDALGNHDGTIDGTVTLGASSIVPALASTAWTLGTNQEGGEVASDTWVNGDSSGIAAEVWVKPSSLPAYSVGIARSSVGASNHKNNKAWAIGYNNNGAVFGRAYSETDNTTQPVSSNGVVTVGNLHHLVFVQTQTSVHYYVDGVQVATDSLSGGPVTYASNTRGITVGRQTTGTGSYVFAGDIQAAAFFGNSLSASQVEDLYNSGLGLSALDGTLDAAVPAIEVSLSGTYTPPTQTGTLDVDLGGVSVAFAGTYNAPGIDGSLAASAPAVEVSIAGNYVPPTQTGSLDVDLPAVELSVSGTYTPPTLTGTLDVDLPGAQVSIAGTYTGPGIEGTLDFTLPGVEVQFTGAYSGAYPTDTSNGNDGLWIDGTATWTWTPDIDPPPTGGGGGGGGSAAIEARAEDVAFAFAPVTIDGATTRYEPVEKRQKRYRQRVIIAGKDVSFFRDHVTQIGDYQLVEPFLYATAVLNFPQILGPFEKPGQGDLAFLAKRSRVVIQSVDDDTNTVISTDFRGYVITWEPEGRALRVEVGGEVRAPAMARIKTQPLFQRRHDAGRIIARMVRQLGVRVRPMVGGVETGIILPEPSGGGFLQALEELHSQTFTRAGAQWTTMPDDDGIYRTARKDRTTIHGTVYLDDTRNVASLRSDLMEETDRVYGTGTSPDGMRINNAVYPGLVEANQVPAFPGPMSEGDSGEGVQVLVNRLKMTPFLNVDEVRGGFDEDVTEAVKALQEQAGLTANGVVNQATWNALWDLDVTGMFTQGARIMPLAQKSYTKKWRHTAGGAYTSRNPNWDKSKWPIDRHIDFGAKHRLSQMREWAKAEIEEAGEHWTGTIRLNTGAIVAGDHTPGDPITSVLRTVEIKPGMNLKLPTLDLTVHVSAVSVSGREVTVAVDTRARDAMEVWQIIERNRASRHNPARAWEREYRNSNQRKDTLGEWSEIGGVINRTRLTGGQWTVFKMVAGPSSGTIRSIRLRAGNGTELAVAVFARSVSEQRLNNRNPNPLTQNGTDWWTDRDNQEWLEDRVLLYQAGGVDDPGGYHPSKKSKGAAFITGDFYDDAQFPYHCLPPVDEAAFGGSEPNYRDPLPILHVAVWASKNTNLQGGRIMWPQAEGGV